MTTDKRPTIFDPFLKGPSHPIFRGTRHVLRPEHIPEKLPHREEEIRTIAAVLAPALKGEQPPNLLIFGKTGTGKTAAIKFVQYEVQEWLRREQKLLESTSGRGPAWEYSDEAVGVVRASSATPAIHLLYLNCKIIDTEYGILAALAKLLKLPEDDDEVIPFTGWPMERVYATLRERLESAAGITVVVLDEIDQYVRKGGRNVLYQLLHLNEELEQARVSLIGISNDLSFTDSLEPRIKTRLGEEKLVFQPYDATQLADILSDRARMAFEPDVVRPEVISLVAALAAQEHGDARRALHLLRMVGEIAEREGSARVEERHVHLAAHRIEVDVLREVIRSLPKQHKVLLLGIVNGYEAGVEIPTGQVYAHYKAVCKQARIAPLTLRRITDLVTELEQLGIIDAKLRSLGRGGGRTRMIRPRVSVLQTKQILAEDREFREIVGFRSQQTTLF